VTPGEIKIAKAILQVLHDLDGGQMRELPLHAEVNLLAPCTVAEFNSALGICDTKGWLTGVKEKLTNKRKWNINDAGEAQLLEMR